MCLLNRSNSVVEKLSGCSLTRGCCFIEVTIMFFVMNLLSLLLLLGCCCFTELTIVLFAMNLLLSLLILLLLLFLDDHVYETYHFPNKAPS